jgi:IS1 family transposase
VHETISGVPRLAKCVFVGDLSIDVNCPITRPQIGHFLGRQRMEKVIKFCTRDSRPQYACGRNDFGISLGKVGLQWKFTKQNIAPMSHVIGGSLSRVLNLELISRPERGICNCCFTARIKSLPGEYWNWIGNIEYGAILPDDIGSHLPFRALSHVLESADSYDDAPYRNRKNRPVFYQRLKQPFAPARLIRLAIGTALFFWGAWPSRRGLIYRGGAWRWLGISLACIGLICLFWERMQKAEGQQSGNEQYIHSPNNVTQKLLTAANYCNTVIGMANVLNTDKQIAVIGALAEGSSIRSIERITGVHRDTIMRLGVKVGKGCATLMDAKMRDLPCRYLEFDEIWGFIGKKEKHVTVDDSPELGDVWTFCAVDAETKIVPTFRCGKRDRATANAFVQDVASRMKNRVQISTDGLRAYVEAIEKSFGADVDYAQIVKTYTHDVEMQPNRRYSAPEIVTTEKKIFSGSPDISRISTSYVERLNGTTRTHMRRLTRLTLAFSKKLENFEAAVSLHFAYYNFVKRHSTLRCTPAMAAGIERDFLSVGDLVEASA